MPEEITLNAEEESALDRAWDGLETDPTEHFAEALAEMFAEHDDDGQRYALMADILGGLFGDEALSLFDEPEKFWEEAQHPRGAKGKFIEKHSAEARSAAKDAIARILKGERTAETHKALVEHLSLLTVAQLHELKKEYGLSASAGLKEQLVSKLADRLGRGRAEGKKEEKAPPKKEAEKPKEKEPWEMSGDEWERGPGKHVPPSWNSHENEVQQALEEGKPVPRKVALEYDSLAAAHQPHLLTPKEFRQATGRDSIMSAAGPKGREEANKEHRAAVQAALAVGKPVPPEVLADYPDLAPKPAPIHEKLPEKSDSPIASDVTSVVQSGSGETPKGEPTMTTATGPVQWKKTSSGYISADGRFEIRRYMRRNGIEWDLVDQLVPVEPGVSGARRNLKDIKDAAEWRVANRKKATE